MPDSLSGRLKRSRIEAGFASTRDAEEAMRGAAKRHSCARAVTHQTIGRHEEEEAPAMPGADVLLCYAIVYKRSPTWLVTGRGAPESWSPDIEEKAGAERMEHYVRTVGRLLIGMAESGEIPAGYDEPSLENPGEKENRGVGTPRREVS